MRAIVALAVGGILLASAPILVGASTTPSDLEAMVRPLLEVESIYLRANYLVRIGKGPDAITGSASLEYWQQGERYRQTTVVDDVLEKAGLFGDSDYSWDGVQGRTLIASNKGVGQAAVPHGELPSAVPNPWFVVLEYLTDRPNDAQRVAPGAAGDRLQALSRKLSAEIAKPHIEASDGTRYELTMDDRQRLKQIVKTTPDDETILIDFEQHTETGGVVFPRKITLNSGEEGMPGIELVIVVTAFEVASETPDERFSIGIPPGHNIWDVERQAFLSADGRMLAGQ